MSSVLPYALIPNLDFEFRAHLLCGRYSGDPSGWAFRSAELTFSQISASIMKISRDHEPASIHSLPPELLHAIFGQLERYTHSTLSACISTCRLWYEVARPHLWSFVVFRRPRAQGRLREFCLSQPDIMPLVKKLRLQGSSPIGLNVPRLASTLRIFPALHTLSLIAFDNRYTEPADTCELNCDQPIPLRKLSIISCSPGTIALSALLRLFSIDTLELYMRGDRTTELSPTYAIPSSLLHSVDLRHLFIECTIRFAMYFDNVFLPLLRPGTLQSFSGVLWSHLSLMCIHNFLCSAPARSLSRLSLQVYINPYTMASAQFHLGMYHVP